MAMYDSSDVKHEFDDAGGTLVDMSAYITDADVIGGEMPTDEITPFGASAETHASTGVEKRGDLTLKGPYDDIATTGPVAIFNAKGATRTYKQTYGGTKTRSVETIIVDFNPNIKVKGVTMFEVKLQQTGVITET